MRSIPKLICALLVAFNLITPATGPARALAVFDGANYSQNLLTAIRTLEIINNQILSLQNQAQSLINQAKNLANLEFSALQQISQLMGQINLLMSRAEGIKFTIESTEQAFKEAYPKVFKDLITNNELIRQAKQRWDYSVESFRHAMRVQAAVSQSITDDQALIGQLVTASQNAVGNLQAQQATNQLLALAAQQAAKTQQMLAAQFRAQAMEGARATATEAAALARFERFIGDGKAYE